MSAGDARPLGLPRAPRALDQESPFWTIDEDCVGLDLWTRRRESWIQGGITHDDRAPSPALQHRREEGRLWRGAAGDGGSREASTGNKEKVFDLCIVQRRTFTRPINLAELIPVMIAGWQKDGTWPKGQSAPPDSD